MPGASGGRNQIAAIAQESPDVVFCGKVSEWETPEYVLDARHQGQKLSLFMLGHIMSEAIPWSVCHQTTEWGVSVRLRELFHSFNPFPLKICCIHFSTLDVRVLDCLGAVK